MHCEAAYCGVCIKLSDVCSVCENHILRSIPEVAAIVDKQLLYDETPVIDRLELCVDENPFTGHDYAAVQWNIISIDPNQKDTILTLMLENPFPCRRVVRDSHRCAFTQSEMIIVCNTMAGGHERVCAFYVVPAGRSDDVKWCVVCKIPDLNEVLNVIDITISDTVIVKVF